MKVDAAAMIDHDSLGPTQKRKEDFKNAGV